MFKLHIDGRDGLLEWDKPALAEAIALAAVERKDRRAPAHASIDGSAVNQDFPA